MKVNLRRTRNKANIKKKETSSKLCNFSSSTVFCFPVVLGNSAIVLEVYASLIMNKE